MFTYLKFNNEKGDESKGQYVKSPEGVAVGDIKGWKYFFDPTYSKGTSVLNRALRNNFAYPDFIPESNTNGLIDITVESKGSYYTTADINPKEWSAFFVIQPIKDPKTTAPASIFRTTNRDLSNADERSMHIAVNSNTVASLNIYKYGSGNPGGSAGIILSYVIPEDKQNKLTAYLVTFSTTDGYTIYCDGKQVRKTTSLVQPELNAGYSSGEWTMYTNYAGKAGLTGLLDRRVTVEETSRIFELLKVRHNLNYN
jgi:hypothetical protein